MIDYRPFRNTDPPALCDLWRSSPPLRAVFQSLTPTILDATVLARPFFDREGFIVAVENSVPIGFVHAGFGRKDDACELDTSIGATAMLLVAEPQRRGEVVQELLRRSEEYLQSRGAGRLCGGASRLVAPFYLGLYGGASVSGVLASDQVQLDAFLSAGYVESVRTSIMQRQLTGFRPVVDRQQMQLKRSMSVELGPDPRSSNWWDACTVGCTDRSCYQATTKAGQQDSGAVVFWDVEPLASHWGLHARGLLGLQVRGSKDCDEERESMALYLLGESLRQMAGRGVTLAEAHVDPATDPLYPLLERLGFREVEQAVILTKP